MHIYERRGKARLTVPIIDPTRNKKEDTVTVPVAVLGHYRKESTLGAIFTKNSRNPHFDIIRTCTGLECYLEDLEQYRHLPFKQFEAVALDMICGDRARLCNRIAIAMRSRDFAKKHLFNRAFQQYQLAQLSDTRQRINAVNRTLKQRIEAHKAAHAQIERENAVLFASPTDWVDDDVDWETNHNYDPSSDEEDFGIDMSTDYDGWPSPNRVGPLVISCGHDTSTYSY